MPKILIVDDNPQNLYLLEILMSTNGYEVSQASNGYDAFEMAKANPPDVIVSDILMPKMDGFTLCKN
jgi:CheY-like chemotaxis protein